MFPKDNAITFIEWRDNTEKKIRKLKADGYIIPGKRIKKIMMRGFRAIMHPDYNGSWPNLVNTNEFSLDN